MIRFKELTAAEFASYKQQLIEDYASHLTRSIATSRQEAQQGAREHIEEMLAQGRLTPGHYLYALIREGTEERVGHLWYFLDEERQRALIHDLSIGEQYGTRSYDVATLTKLTGELRAVGVKRIELRVFAHDSRSISLYQHLGYRTIGILLQKDL